MKCAVAGGGKLVGRAQGMRKETLFRKNCPPANKKRRTILEGRLNKAHSGAE